MRPPGKDALQRRALREAERRERQRRTRERYGPDLAELEPCGWCGRALCCPPACPVDAEAGSSTQLERDTLIHGASIQYCK